MLSQQQITSPMNLPSEIQETLDGMEKSRIDPYLFELLHNCPELHEGVNPWLFKVAYQLVLYFDDDDDVRQIIEEYVNPELPPERCEREIPLAVQNARKYRTQSPEERAASLSTPKRRVRYDYISKRVLAEGKGQYSKWPDWSPVKGHGLEAGPVIDTIFPHAQLLGTAFTKWSARTRSRESLRGCENVQEFIVPSPMTALTGINKRGKISTRCLDNTGPRVYLVIECDIKPKGPWGPYIARRASDRLVP
jgi:hypothetical protein